MRMFAAMPMRLCQSGRCPSGGFVAFLCQLLVNTGAAGVTRMVMHAQSHAQAYLAAQELFPACSVEVVALELPPPHEPGTVRIHTARSSATVLKCMDL